MLDQGFTPQESYINGLIDKQIATLISDVNRDKLGTVVQLAKDTNAKTGNKNISLSQSMRNFRYLVFVIARPDLDLRIIPVSNFVMNSSTYMFYASTSGTTRDTYVHYVNDTTIYYNGTSIGNNSTLEIYGLY